MNKKEIGQFEEEKTYSIGFTTFVVQHEYIGTKKMGELLANIILKSEETTEEVRPCTVI